MNVKNFHPDYQARMQSWNLCRDCFAGQERIKSKGLVYLPATPGMIFDGMGFNQPGLKAYEQYKLRSVFSNYLANAVETIIGLLHTNPPVIELPKELEFMRENATDLNEPLDILLRRINVEQLITGRLGLSLDLDSVEKTEIIPHISLYPAESIINWDYDKENNGYSLVVLNESGIKRENEFEWKNFEKYRVLKIDPQNGIYVQNLYTEISNSSETEYLEILPRIKGKPLKEIPFVIVNSNDLNPNTDEPPLLDLAQISLSIYRSEADYRQTLFQLSQDTLVVIGAQDNEINGGEKRIGAGASLFLPMGADAKFIGINSTGIVEQRAALENDKMVANNRSVQLVDTRSAQRESGQALHVRAAAQTATLNQIALTGAAALQKILKVAATWVGANPDDVIVEPNKDFIRNDLTGSELSAIMQAKAMGAPISMRSIHEIMTERGFTTMDFEEEIALLSEDDFLLQNNTQPIEPTEQKNPENEPNSPKNLQKREQQQLKNTLNA